MGNAKITKFLKGVEKWDMWQICYEKLAKMRHVAKNLMENNKNW